MEISIENQSTPINITNEPGDEPNLCENLEFWMSQLPPRLQALPIINLAIPGSHNSMTYTINRNNDIGPDEPPVVRNMCRYFPVLAKPVIFNWSVNQEENIKDQLNGGIRYLDLRVATKSNDENVYFLHGLYGAEVRQPLQDVADWLSKHPHEVIIIDFQHFYNFTEDHHESLINQVKNIFRGQICPVLSTLDTITLQWMNAKRHQVFVVYRNLIAQKYKDLWPTRVWPTPWPNTVNPVKLVNFLNDGLRNRLNNIGFISQCLLTPDTSYVIKHICGNLHRDLLKVCRRVTMPWIEENSPGNGGMNIVITDFVSTNNCLFSRTVIQRNTALLKLQSHYPYGLNIQNESN